MLTKRIIPCLDIKNSRVVKGVHFLNLKDAGDPIKIADYYSKAGADEIVFLDITATIEKRKTILKLVEHTAEQIFIPLTVGGGIRNTEDIKLLLKYGADKVSINTAAVKNPQLIKEASEKFGSQCIVVAIDAKQSGIDKWEVYINAGTTPTGINAIEWTKKVAILGAGEILLTSMDADGTKNGYDIELTRQIVKAVNLPIIASGGAGNPKHIYQVLNKGKADAALVASIFHYEEFTITEVKKYLKERNILVRIETNLF